MRSSARLSPLVSAQVSPNVSTPVLEPLCEPQPRICRVRPGMYSFQPVPIWAQAAAGAGRQASSTANVNLRNIISLPSGGTNLRDGRLSSPSADRRTARSADIRPRPR
jgi:hypothetical protein